jgi:hypothetical protein
MNSGDEDTMLVTVNGQPPPLLTVSGWSLNEPTQTSPKSPAFAIARTSLGAGVEPLTRTFSGLEGSLLVIVSVADVEPRLLGWKRIGSSTESPAATKSGKN